MLWPWSSAAALIASSKMATSRTLRPIPPRTVHPYQWSSSGASGTRPRWGFSPNSPQKADGIRIEPPPSEPSATGTMPAATAAALPPEEPPGERSRFHGLRVTPCAAELVKWP